MPPQNKKRQRRRSDPNSVPFRNKTPYGWWVTECVECIEPVDANRNDLSRRCLAWRNTMIFKAADRDDAYRKAMSMGRVSDSLYTRGGKRLRHRFVGLTMLLPIYEEIDDWTEVLWTERRGVSMKRVQSWVKKKHELEAFDDSNDQNP